MTALLMDLLCAFGVLCYIVAGIRWSEMTAVSADERIARRLVWGVGIPLFICFVF